MPRKTNLKIQLGNRIKKLRIEKELTQEGLGKKIGVGKTAIANYESGYSEPDNDKMIALADFFNVSLDYLMGLTSHRNAKEELEKELYKFDLTEDEYYSAINCFMNDAKTIQGLAFTLKFTPDSNNEEINREKEILSTIISYILDFIPSYISSTNEITEETRNEFYNNFNKALSPAKKLLLSLDKNKIIHHKNSNEKWKTIANYMKENNLKSLRILPIYGVIKAGEPAWAEQNIIGHIPFDVSLDNYSETEEYFYLKVDGESMNQVIKNGDFALIQKQTTAENGDIVVALVNGYDATLKRFKRINNQFVSLEPMSNDTSFESITVDLKTTNFQILGKFIGYFGKYKNK